jgi:hypothetical protein
MIVGDIDPAHEVRLSSLIEAAVLATWQLTLLWISSSSIAAIVSRVQPHRGRQPSCFASADGFKTERKVGDWEGILIMARERGRREGGNINVPRLRDGKFTCTEDAWRDGTRKKCLAGRLFVAT